MKWKELASCEPISNLLSRSNCRSGLRQKSTCQLPTSPALQINELLQLKHCLVRDWSGVGQSANEPNILPQAHCTCQSLLASSITNCCCWNLSSGSLYTWTPWNLSFWYILFHEKRLQTMLWHHNATVNSHQRWKQTRFRVCFHLWCELTSTMNVTEWQVSWNSWCKQ